MAHKKDKKGKKIEKDKKGIDRWKKRQGSV